jgi:hypothetical protein
MESKFVQAGPVKLEYFEQGHGLDMVVLIHGCNLDLYPSGAFTY